MSDELVQKLDKAGFSKDCNCERCVQAFEVATIVAAHFNEYVQRFL